MKMNELWKEVLNTIANVIIKNICKTINDLLQKGFMSAIAFHNALNPFPNQEVLFCVLYNQVERRI